MVQVCLVASTTSGVAYLSVCGFVWGGVAMVILLRMEYFWIVEIAFGGSLKDVLYIEE